MPVEIFELVIRANVKEASSENTATDNKVQHPKKKSTDKEIAEQVLELINRKKER